MLCLILGLGILLGFGLDHFLSRFFFLRSHWGIARESMEIHKPGHLDKKSYCVFCMGSHRPILPWRYKDGKWRDRWGTELRYQNLEGDFFERRSAGRDRVFDTADDLYVRYRSADSEK